MTTSIERSMSNRKVLSLTTAQGTTGRLNYEDASGARIYIPAGSSITTLTYYDAPVDEADDTTVWYEAMDDADTPAAIVRTVEAGKSYPIPEALFGARFIAIKADAAGDVYVTKKG
jgi:hypothetical protein